MFDDESDFEKVIDKTVHKNMTQSIPQVTDSHNKRRQDVIIKNYPENDKAIFRHPKHVPGNSSYAGIAKDGKKIMILSDSIPSRIIMKEFNYYVKIGHVLRTSFPGTP